MKIKLHKETVNKHETENFQTIVGWENIRNSNSIFEDIGAEDILKMIRDFKTFIDAYTLWIRSTAVSIYSKFRRCLQVDS